MPLEDGLNCAELRADAAAVDQADFGEPVLASFCDVVRDEGTGITRRERV